MNKARDRNRRRRQLERNAEVDAELLRSGYSLGDIEAMRRVLDNDNLEESDLVDMPMPILLQHAAALNIARAGSLPKHELIDAIRSSD